MARHGMDDVEVVELTFGDTPPTGVEEPPPARPYGRRTVLAAVVMSTVLVVAAATWFAVVSHPRHVTRTVQAPAATGLDAGGCPIGSSCRIDAIPQSALYREAARWFPDDDIVFATSVRDVDVRTVYRQTVLIRTTAGAQVLAVATCVPHGRPVTLPTTVRVDQDPTVLQTVLVAGARAGCSTAVSSHSPTDSLLGAMNRLAQDGANYG